MLSEEQIDWLADRINEKIDLPLLGEKSEKAIIRTAISKVLDLLEDELPEEFVNFIDDVSDGFEPQNEAQLALLKDNTARFLNNNINIPLLSERSEKRLFDSLIDFLFDAMQKGSKLGDD